MHMQTTTNSAPWPADAHSRDPYTNLSQTQMSEIGKKAVKIGSTHIDAILHHLF